MTRLPKEIQGVTFLPALQYSVIAGVIKRKTDSSS